MQVVGTLEQKYWTRTTTAGCSILVDSALANRRRSVDGLAARIPEKTPLPRPEPPRYWFHEFEVTTPATLRRDAADSVGIEGRSGPLVQFVVGPPGDVDTATVKIIGARGYDMTRQQAQELLRMWRFAPATMQGCPVPELLQMTVPASGSSK